MIELGGRRYRLPARRTAVVCVDGCAPEYLELALADGLMPRLRGALDAGGFATRGRGQMPSFTNPNNLSIVTGLPPSGHGISGNFYFDADAVPGGAEVPMNEPRFLRSATIFERMEQAGVRTLCVTAKEKLRALLGAVQDPRSPRPTALSVERAHEQGVPELGGRSILEVVGRRNPGIYDWDASHYAMEMALALHGPLGARLVYVSLTDYVQHKEPPRGPLSDRFLARLDELLGAFLDAGFVCGITADHGMNDKTAPDGSPRVRYLEDALAAAGVAGHRVILPITDPYVVHHGALGSYATVHVPPSFMARAAAALAAEPGVEAVLGREEAAARFSLPADRIGDLVVLGDRHTVLGKSEGHHDLSAVRRGLRSHGGLHEQEVPVVVTCPLAAPLPGTPSNADIFDLVLNRVA